MDAAADLGFRLLDFPLGLRHPTLQGLDRGPGGLVGRLGHVVLAAGHELGLEQASNPFKLAAGLPIRALGADDVGAHRVGGGATRLEPRARFFDGRFGRLHPDHRHLHRGARLVDLGTRAFTRQRHLGARRSEIGLRGGDRRARLLTLGLEIAGVDPHEQIALLDDLVVLDEELDHVAGDLRADG